MDFFLQTFTFQDYYLMVKSVFDNVGYDYYKGLKNKLPPIRYLGIDDYNNQIVSFAHPRDFLNDFTEFKNAFDNIIYDNNISNINIDNKKNEILEIYPSTVELHDNPNGFIALFVNEIGMKILKKEFHSNDEVTDVHFLKVNRKGISLENLDVCGVIASFIDKFNERDNLISKYSNLYLAIGKMNELDIKTGEIKMTNKYNIIGGKRSYDENSIESTIREASEELGLTDSSKIYNLIKILVPKSKDIIRCHSFLVYCLYICPKTEYDYDFYIHNNIQNNIQNKFKLRHQLDI